MVITDNTIPAYDAATNRLVDGPLSASASGGVVIAAGGTSGPPLNFTSGTLATSPVSGAIEFDGRSFYFTPSSLSRRAVMGSIGVRTARTTVPANSNATVQIYSLFPPENTLASGRQIEFMARGSITQRNNAASFYTIRLLINGSPVLTFTTNPSEELANEPFEISLVTTMRSTGVAGTQISSGVFTVGELVAQRAQGAQTILDTTIASSYVVDVTANEANAATGPVLIEQGRGFIVDNNS